MLSSVVTRSSPSSATQEISSVRSDLVARVLWRLPKNIAADIGLVGCWRSLSGPCHGPLRTSTCIMTRQPSAQITSSPTPTSAPLADIRSQRTMPSACGGALPASSALRTEPASVPVSFRPPGCSLTTDLARFAVRSSGLRGRQAGPSQAAPSSCPRQIAGTSPEHWEGLAQAIR